jgi:UDP-glucose 4-epimerase
MAKHAKESGEKHFVFMRTVKVYGEFTTKGYALHEKTPCKLIDPYRKSKLGRLDLL